MSRAIWLLAYLGVEAEQKEAVEGEKVSEAQSTSTEEQPAQKEQSTEAELLMTDISLYT